MQKITLSIEGMACGMCEAHINDAVRKAFAVKKVNSSHTKKETVILTEEDLDEDSLAAVIADAGYEMNGFKKEPYDKKGLFSFLKK
jgi:copper chaperone CopZ